MSTSRLLNPFELQRLESCIAKATDPLELEAIKKHLLTKQVTVQKDRYAHEPPVDKNKLVWPQERPHQNTVDQAPIRKKRDLSQRISFSESDSGIESPPHTIDYYEFNDVPAAKRSKTQGEISKRRQHLEAERKSRKRVERAYCLLKLLIIKPDALDKDKKAIAYGDEDFKRLESILESLNQGTGINSVDGCTAELPGKISLPKHQVYMLAFDELKMLRQHVLTSDNNISILKHQMLKAELENKKLKRQLCKFSASFNQMKDALGTEQYLTGALIKSLSSTPQLPFLSTDPLASRTSSSNEGKVHLQQQSSTHDSVAMMQLLGLLKTGVSGVSKSPTSISPPTESAISSDAQSDIIDCERLSPIDFTQTPSTTSRPFLTMPNEPPPPYPSVSLTELSLNSANCSASTMTVTAEKATITHSSTLVANNSQLTAKKANMLCLALVGLLFLNPLDILSQFLQSKSDLTIHAGRTLLSTDIRADSVPTYIYQTYVRPVLFVLLFTILSLNNSHRCRPGSQEETIIMDMIKTSSPAKGQRKSEILHALRCLGTRPATTYIYMMVNILWKVFFHILYQLGVLARLKRIQAMLLYKNAEEEQEENYSYGLIARLHASLHESSMKESKQNVLETTYYIWSAICAAEVSGNRELMCQMYMTGALHMKKQSFAFSSFLLYYFTTLGRHNAYDESGAPLPSVEWMFESRAFEYISSGRWHLRKVQMMQSVEKDNLLHIVRSWFKRDLIIDTIDQLVSGTSAGGQMDVSDTCLMLLVLLRNSDRKWQKEEVTSVQSCQVDAFCGFWGCLLTQVELIRRTGSVDVPALKQVDYYYDTLTERNNFNEMARDAFLVYVLTKMYNTDPKKSIQLKDSVIAMPLIKNLLTDACVKFDLFIGEKAEGLDNDLVKACSILICQMLLDASINVLQHEGDVNSQQIYHFHKQLNYLQQHVDRYPEFNTKLIDYSVALQKIADINPVHLQKMSSFKKPHKNSPDENQQTDWYGARRKYRGSWLPAELLLVLSLIPMTLLYSRFTQNLFQTS